MKVYSWTVYPAFPLLVIPPIDCLLEDFCSLVQGVSNVVVTCQVQFYQNVCWERHVDGEWHGPTQIVCVSYEYGNK